MSVRFSTNSLLTGFAVAVKAAVTLISLGFICWLLWVAFVKETDTTPPPYQVFVVRDASAPQRFVLPANNRLHAVWLEYEIDGAVNGNAAIQFKTQGSAYDNIPLAGTVHVHDKRDFFEIEDVLIDYQPTGNPTGELVIKVRVL
ncbi:MAG: hypothetical protein EOO39_01350 [Cytophagaceae bacterium]|nr:MAG: hypothetical protein EOO39_01350 [Cytophagaceae bacterium]